MCPAAAGREGGGCGGAGIRTLNPQGYSREAGKRIIELEEGDMVTGMGRRVSLSFAEDVLLLHIAKCVCMQRAISVKLSLTAWNVADVCNIVHCLRLLRNFCTILNNKGQTAEGISHQP